MMNSLRIRLLLSHLALILFIIPFLGVVLIYVLETRVVLANLSTQLARQASLLADFCNDYPQLWQNSQAAQQFVERFDKNTTAQIMLVDGRGRLLASSDARDLPLVGQPVANPGLQGARLGQVVERTDYSQNLQSEVADIWAPVHNAQGEFLGAVRLTHQLVNVRERFQRLRNAIVTVLALGLVLGSLTAVALAITLERPITVFSAAVYRMAVGDDLQPVPEHGPAELRTLASAFNALVDRLLTLRSARRRLLANLVHELGRPLGALRSANQALLDGAQEQPELRQSLLGGIDVELASMQRVLDDLSRLYHQDVGRLELELQRAALAPWLQAILAPWAQNARARHLQWQTDIPAGLPALRFDSDRLAQAVGNLLSNAIKFSPAGGAIGVSAGATEREIWITIEDDGPGIASAEQEQVFEPFFRSARRRLPEGMGLGLAIARDLVAAHGGRLQLDSEPQQGSRFTIWLPR